jgi:Peptidase family M23
MKSVLTPAMLCYFALALTASVHAQEAGKSTPPRFPPPQITLQVPFEPSAFPSAGRTHLSYELYLTNFSPQSLTLSRIEVLDADGSPGKTVAAFEGKPLTETLQAIGTRPTNAAEVAGGATLVAFLWVTLDAGAHVPHKLSHRVLVDDSPVEGAVVDTHHTKVRELGPPVRGGEWYASDAPNNETDNHHRRGLVVLDSKPVISRRYAIDWQLVKSGLRHTGNDREVAAYYSYGQPLMAVASGTVINAHDGLPDNTPGHGAAFQTAVPITLDTVGGNTITLDIGGGQYAYYFHMKPGSVRVKTGDRVRRGQVIGQIGCSGDAREPHLHFEITNSAKPLAGEGVPYVIDRYRMRMVDADPWQSRTNELPMRNMLIEFD